jgi:hypothetical protein
MTSKPRAGVTGLRGRRRGRLDLLGNDGRPLGFSREVGNGVDGYDGAVDAGDVQPVATEGTTTHGIATREIRSGRHSGHSPRRLPGSLHGPRTLRLGDRCYLSPLS